LGRIIVIIPLVLWLNSMAWLTCGQNGSRNQVNVPDSSEIVRIDKIFIIGNKKTREHIIRRELSLNDKAEISRNSLTLTIESDKRKLLNTGLFLSAEINVVDLSMGSVDIIIRVEERWYFFPIPIFNLADRNFTEWWVNQGADLSRVDWGIRLRHFNFRGRREILNLTAQFGYTKLFRLSYQLPYIDKKQKIGLSFYGDYSTNKNVAFATVDHRQQFMDSETVLRERWRAGINFTYRPDFYAQHSIGLHVSSAHIADTIRNENPNYFLDGENEQRYFALTYMFTWDYRDYVAYPLSGAYFRLTANKIGFGIYNDVNMFSVNARYSRYFDLGKKFYFGTNITGNASTPSTQPFYNYQSVGSVVDFVRGYERYLIEGQHYLVNRNTLKRQLFSFEADLRNFISMKQFNKVPLAAYLSLNFDQGYVVNYPEYQQNQLFTDRYIFGGGLGLDIVTFYDFVMRWEYSVNIEGENALFFNLFAAF